jgi:hypothetical protein
VAILSVKTYQWLGIGPDKNFTLATPFMLFAALLQFGAFKWLFFEHDKKSTAFLAYIAVFLISMLLMSGLAVLLS